MQRQPLTNSSKNEEENSGLLLDVALTKPDDVGLFYTASVHFLQKRLEEKALSTKTKSQPNLEICNIKKASHNSPRHLQNRQITLPMHEILPFPKSSKEGFISRIMKSFRKFKVQNIANHNDDEVEMVQIKSNYKFPQCGRHKNHSSCLNAISEDDIKEDNFETISNCIVNHFEKNLRDTKR